MGNSTGLALVYAHALPAHDFVVHWFLRRCLLKVWRRLFFGNGQRAFNILHASGTGGVGQPIFMRPFLSDHPGGPRGTTTDIPVRTARLLTGRCLGLHYPLQAGGCAARGTRATRSCGTSLDVLCAVGGVRRYARKT